jgi:hypothetical protein
MKQERVDFSTIDEVLAHKFVGNHASDMQAFMGIERFMLRDDATEDEQHRALNHMIVEGMGMDPLTEDEARREINDRKQRDAQEAPEKLDILAGPISDPVKRVGAMDDYLAPAYEAQGLSEQEFADLVVYSIADISGPDSILRGLIAYLSLAQEDDPEDFNPKTPEVIKTLTDLVPVVGNLWDKDAE